MINSRVKFGTLKGKCCDQTVAYQQTLPEVLFVGRAATAAFEDNIFSIGNVMHVGIEIYNTQLKLNTNIRYVTVNDNTALVVLDGCLYLIGGIRICDISNKVLKYDVSKEKWSDEASINQNHSRFNATASTFNGDIYLFGGYKYESQSTVYALQE